MPPALVCAFPAESLTENVPLGTSVTSPSAVAVTVTVYVEPEPDTVTAVPFVAVKSDAVTVAALSASLLVSVKAIEATFAGSAWPAACASVTVGAVASYVTARSVPPAVACVLPATSATEKPAAGAIETTPSPVAVVVSVKVEPEPVIVTADPLVTVKSPGAIVAASSCSFAVSVNWMEAALVGST